MDNQFEETEFASVHITGHAQLAFLIIYTDLWIASSERSMIIHTLSFSY